MLVNYLGFGLKMYFLYKEITDILSIFFMKEQKSQNLPEQSIVYLKFCDFQFQMVIMECDDRECL